MNSNSNNDNVGGGVIKSLSRKLTQQESTDADRRRQEKEKKIEEEYAKDSLILEKIEKEQNKIEEDDAKDRLTLKKIQETQNKRQEETAKNFIKKERIQKKQNKRLEQIAKYFIEEERKQEKIQEKKEKEVVQRSLQQICPDCEIPMMMEAYEQIIQNRPKPIIHIYKNNIWTAKYIIDDKANITILRGEVSYHSPSGFAQAHIKHSIDIQNISPKTRVNGWDTCEIVNEEGEWVKLDTIRPPKSDDDA